MFPHLKGFNLKQWIDENRGDWGQRRVIWQDSDFIAFVTRGPNRRKDFHINPGDEIFYQLEGELNLHYLEDDKHELAVLKAGDIFLLPKNTPHSPRRADGSWTYVVERTRPKRKWTGSSGPAKNAATIFMRPMFASTIPAMRSATRRTSRSKVQIRRWSTCKPAAARVLDL